MTLIVELPRPWIQLCVNGLGTMSVTWWQSKIADQIYQYVRDPIIITGKSLKYLLCRIQGWTQMPEGCSNGPRSHPVPGLDLYRKSDRLIRFAFDSCQGYTCVDGLGTMAVALLRQSIVGDYRYTNTFAIQKPEPIHLTTWFAKYRAAHKHLATILDTILFLVYCRPVQEAWPVSRF